MNYYIADFTQHDGEHEHIDRVVLAAAQEEEARKVCSAELYDCNEEPEGSFFGYGDGETAVSDYHLRPISQSDYDVLREYLSDLTAMQA